MTNEDMQVLVELISAGHEQVIDAIDFAARRTSSAGSRFSR